MNNETSDGKYSIVDVFNKAQELAEANAQQETYISAGEARKLGAGNAEWRIVASEIEPRWYLCTEQINYCDSIEYRYRAIKQAQPEPVDPHATFRAEYQRQRNAVPCELGFYLWEFKRSQETKFSTIKTSLGEFYNGYDYRCTDVSCMVSKDGKPAVRMLRTDAQKLQRQTKDTHDWFYDNGAAAIRGDVFGFDSQSDLPYSYKTKATIKLDGKMVTWADMPVGIAVQTVNKKMLCTFVGTNGDLLSVYNKTIGADDYRASRFELAPAADQPWVNWRGGDCPVPVGVLVEVTLRNGKVKKLSLNELDWKHTLDTADIIEYRITGLAEGYKMESSV
jgi:hypothetical protein